MDFASVCRTRRGQAKAKAKRSKRIAQRKALRLGSGVGQCDISGTANRYRACVEICSRGKKPANFLLRFDRRRLEQMILSGEVVDRLQQIAARTLRRAARTATTPSVAEHRRPRQRNSSAKPAGRHSPTRRNPHATLYNAYIMAKAFAYAFAYAFPEYSPFRCSVPRANVMPLRRRCERITESAQTYLCRSASRPRWSKGLGRQTVQKPTP